MKINKELIEKVAKIARVNLNEKEKDEFIKEFNDILDIFSKISKVSTDNIELSVQPVKVENKFREDKVGKCLSEKEVFLNAEHKEKGFFKGPKIL